MRSRLLPVVVGLTALALAATGCSAEVQRSAPIAAPDVIVQPSAEPSPVAEPSAEPSASPSPSPSPSPAKPLPPPYDVRAVQTSLTALGYYLGAVDGERGPALRSAVMAFQKVQGIGADGIVGKATLAALKAPRKPSLRGTAPADRVEVDLTKQVLYVVKGGAITRILPVSSGNGKTYLQKNGSKARALTPVGYYRIQRRIVGLREADLGSLYDPQYFYRGWAIHGSNSVPAFPASHGCIRVTRADAKYLLRAISVGMSVYIYGGTHTFTAGSSAPGTDNPTGDTPQDTAPSPEPTQAAPSPVSEPSPEPTQEPTPQTEPSPQPSPTGSGTSRAGR